MSIYAIYYTVLHVADSISDETEIADYSQNEREHAFHFEKIESGAIADVRTRFNVYFQNPEVIDFNRGQQFLIEGDEMESKKLYSEGGGCGAWTQFFIRKME